MWTGNAYSMLFIIVVPCFLTSAVQWIVQKMFLNVKIRHKYTPDMLHYWTTTVFSWSKRTSQTFQQFLFNFNGLLVCFNTDCDCVKWCSWNAITVPGKNVVQITEAPYKYVCLCSICLIHFPEVQYLAKPQMITIIYWGEKNIWDSWLS